jgi:hypothetical protein
MLLRFPSEKGIFSLGSSIQLGPKKAVRWGIRRKERGAALVLGKGVMGT